MERLAEKIRLIGPKRATVLISGETGTGKEMTARALHAASPRSSLPLVAVNCTALPEALLEAELFGHVRGAFTGAVQSRIGRFEQANRSTLFLDEIGDMPADTQAKLLRVLQEREFQRIGSSETVRVDVRVVAATNVNLEQRIAAGKFREDLFYRLNVVPLRIPALRERVEDIPLLVAHFIDKVCHAEGVASRQVAPQAMDLLQSYDWPGNVRQLENTVENAIALSGDRTVLLPHDFHLPSQMTPPPPLLPHGRIEASSSSSSLLALPLPSLPDGGIDFEQTVGRIELHLLEQALRKTGGNKTQAADMLRLKRTTLTAKLRVLSRTVMAGAPN
jgi:DNA-binding NtrC family response regulator